MFRNKVRLSEHTETMPMKNKTVQEKYEDWLTSHWRPMVAYTYICIIGFDFVLGPILFVIFASFTGEPLVSWIPLTLDQGGIFHITMGAILGVASWTRGMEKVERTRENGRTRDRFDRDSRGSNGSTNDGGTSDYEFQPPKDFGNGN